MQFNYNTGGLNVDITDALNIRRQRMAEKDAKKEAEQAKRLRELNTQINEALSSNPSADVSSLYREMAGIDRTAAKEYQQMNAEMDIEQQRSLFDTVKEMKMYEQMGRGDLAEKTVSERLNLLEQYKGNSNHTKLLKSIYEDPNLDEDQRIKKLDAITQYGIQKGVVEPPPSKDLVHLGQRADSDGKYYDAIQNQATGEITRHYSGDSRQKELENEQAKSRSKSSGLRPMNKELSARTGVLKTQIDNAERMEGLTRRVANGMDKLAKKGEWDDKGVAATVNDAIKTVFGAQGEDEFTRIIANKARNIIALADRAPGAVSNFEFKQYLAGTPPSNANPAMQAEYYKGLQEAASISKSLDRLEGAFIENSRNLFTNDREFTIHADGLSVDVKAGDTPETVKIRWLEKANARKGEQIQKELKKIKEKPISELSDLEFRKLLKSRSGG